MKEMVSVALILVIVMLSGFVAVASGQQTTFNKSALTFQGQRAFDELRRIKLFAIGGIGYGGETSKGELALDVLIEEKESLEAFKQLIQNGTTEGAMYGLFGLRMLRCDCFDKEFTSLKSIHFSETNSERFTHQAGCILMPADNPKDKSLILDEIMKDWFGKHADIKECKRKTNGQPGAFAKCIKEVGQ